MNNDENKNILDSVKKALTLRNVLLGILIAIIILFPTSLAIMNIAYTNSDRAASSGRASEVVMYSSDGTELYREAASEGLTGDTSLISIFNTIYDNLSATDKKSPNVVTAEPVVVKITGNEGVTTLTCYFSFTEGGSFCVDEAGDYYKIRSEDSERFLESSFAETLYKESTPPTLKSTDGDVILPVEASWRYQNIDGKFTVSEKLKLAETDGVYDMVGGISFDFSAEPDNCSIEIYDSGTQVFSGAVDDLDKLILRSDSALDVTIYAEWLQKNERAYYGSVKYRFGVTVRDRAEFFISSSEVSRDGFIVVRGTNVLDLSKLKFSSDTSDVIPQFSMTGQSVYAIIPCADIPKQATSFDITLSYGVSSTTFSVNVTDKEVPSQVSLKNTADILGIPLESISSDHAEYLFVNGKTVSPDASRFTRSAEYGDTVEYNNGNIRSCFTEYKCISGYGVPVKAVSGGKVVYVGQSTAVGNYAVVDLGLGLRVWYCNLSVVDVQVGKYVSTGDIIGKTGTLLDAKSEGFSLMLSFGGVILNSDALL